MSVILVLFYSEILPGTVFKLMLIQQHSIDRHQFANVRISSFLPHNIFAYTKVPLIVYRPTYFDHSPSVKD